MSALMERHCFTPEAVPPGVHSGMYIGLVLARVFRDKCPTVAGLRQHFGMSRANAYRWVAAWKAANGAA